MRLGGGEDKLGVLRRLFEGLQQGVEGAGREHVHLVNDEDLVTGAARQVADVLAQLADIIDAGVGGAIDLDYVKPLTGSDLLTGGALVAGLSGEAFFAVEGLGQDPGGRGLADPAGAGKQEGVMDAAGADGVRQGLADMLLANQVSEVLWAPFAGEYQIGHNRARSLVELTTNRQLAGTSDSQAPPRHTAEAVTAAPFRA